MNTHRLAVIAYVIHDNKFLLLKRNFEPKIWGPPGGRLEVNENPLNGVLREIREECSIDIKVMGIVDVWFGTYRSEPLTSIDYLAETETDRITISDEHYEFRWCSLEDLKSGHPYLENSPTSFPVESFEKAWTLYRKLKN